jgi:hypothetical protein
MEKKKRFHLTHVRIGAPRTQTTTNVGEDVRKKEPSCVALGTVS